MIHTADAAWTGTSLSIDEIESDWVFEASQRVSDTTRLNLHFEEKTVSGISVGANIGRLTTRISNAIGPRNTEKFDASYLGVYIRYPLAFGEHFMLHNRLGYQFHSGSIAITMSTNTASTDVTSSDQIEWRDATYQIGLSARMAGFRIMPFAAISDVNGDIERENSTDTFKNETSLSSGLSIDFFVDPTSFVQFRFTSGAKESFSLRFAREF